jgi:SAM-dependent methyltransferase
MQDSPGSAAAPAPALVSPYTSFNSLNSARGVVPIVLDLVPARSVVDFGCKHGEWLTEFREHGVSRLLGFDQQKRIAQGLLVRDNEFVVADLRQPVPLKDRFDLAVCLEVAEHLPASSAAPLVATLTSAAPAILFSAAVPGQGGHGHLNEQPRQYWTDLFTQHRYRALDCLRPRIWQNPDVAFWYRQNLFLFANEEVQRSPQLQPEATRRIAQDLELVHVGHVNRHPLRALASLAALTLSRGLKRTR